MLRPPRHARDNAAQQLVNAAQASKQLSSLSLSKGWKIIKLGDVCLKTANIKWNLDSREYFQYVDLSAVSRETLEITESTVVDSTNAPSRAKKIMHSGDVLFATTRPTMKRSAIVLSEYDGQICSTGFTVLRPDTAKIESKYIHYVLQSESFMDEMKGLQRGASYPAVTDSDVKGYEVPIPPLEEQKQIVDLLDKTFAAIDQAKANVEKNLQNAKELFQSKLNEIFTQKGEGWEERKLGDESLVKMIDGDRGKNYPKKSDFFTEGHCVFMNTGNVRPNGFDFSNVMFITEERDNLLRKGKLQRDDVVMTTRGTIGNLGWFNKDIKYDNIRINSGMLVFRVNPEKILPEFLYTVFRSPLVTKQIVEMTSGAAQPQLPIKTLVHFNIPIHSDLSKQKEMVSKIQEMELFQDKLIQVYNRKITSLDELKKPILQKAFSGELI